MAKDHFVPRHYLRRFSINKSELIVVAKVSPYKYLGPKGIGGQCQEDEFYENNEALDKVWWGAENDIAPVLVRVSQNEDFNEQELVALRWLVATLHVRTKRAIEASKVLPKYICYDVIKYAIDRGELPPPPDGKWSEQLIDFKGAAALLSQLVLPCSMEMQTLAAKLLKAESGTFFITSDNPVVRLNQFCSAVEPFRSYAGFGRSGFQSLLPISPALCLLFYDPKVYKVGSRRHRLIEVSKSDVEIINSLQVQSADDRVYFHEPSFEKDIEQLIGRYGNLRFSNRDFLRTILGKNPNEELLHFRAPSMKLPRLWACCRLRRHVDCQVGDRRHPAWTALIEELMNDLEKHPGNVDIQQRIEKIIADPNSLQNIRLR
jgi:hypothetical protein